MEKIQLQFYCLTADHHLKALQHIVVGVPMNEGRGLQEEQLISADPDNEATSGT